MAKNDITKGYSKDGLNIAGQEMPDPTPMAPPIGYRREPSMVERIRDMVRSEHMRLAALSEGKETFDEADDFDVDEEFDPSTPYEENFDPVDSAVRQELRFREHSARVRRRLDRLDELMGVKNDGKPNADKGRVEDSGEGSRRSDSVDKGDAKPVGKSDDGGSES